MATQILELHELPTDIRAYFLALPAFQNAMRVTKSVSMETGSAVTVTKTLKTSRLQQVKKAANLPSFAQILAGSNARNIGTPAPAIPKAPAPTTTSTDAILARANANGGGAGITRVATNTPKVPIPSRHEPVTYASLQAAIDAAMSRQRDEAKAEAFNAGRSAFSRITKTQEHHVQGGGRGDAWSLRNIGGKLVSAVLNGTARKTDGKPVGSSALDVAFGRGR